MIPDAMGESVQPDRRGNQTLETIDRSLVTATYLVVWVAFFVTQRIFAGLHRMPSEVVVALVTLAMLMRLAELLYFRRGSKRISARVECGIAFFSISSTLVLALLLAIASQEPDSPYFGMLMVPILETAVYFSLRSTVLVAATSSAFSIFWVFYSGHFRPPFAMGEMMESATLVLVFFIVGSLVWFLMNRIRMRTYELSRKMEDLERTRYRLVEEEKLAAVGKLASSVAHEIRNPVAIISGALEAAESATFGEAEREEMSRVAMVEARRLEKLASDFLSYAQISSEPFEPLDLGTLAGYVEAVVRVQAMSKRLRVNLRMDTVELCIVRGNEGQLQQVLLNLMRNAVDAAPEGSTIGVQVHPCEAGEAVITIENEGQAIPDSVVPRIFEPFFTNKANGTGLGLAIARRIVERHKGQLLLVRNEADHIVFQLTLPAVQQPQHASSVVA
ncbi:MAG TPA: HAMP domain-containing sensor histidine kinase [Acidobacteriaceae bacterium]|nr:HAMP domain-containing sensor histidine kinase [Acidobacteriaceae bacterium]